MIVSSCITFEPRRACTLAIVRRHSTSCENRSGGCDDAIDSMKKTPLNGARFKRTPVCGGCRGCEADRPGEHMLSTGPRLYRIPSAMPATRGGNKIMYSSTTSQSQE